MSVFDVSVSVTFHLMFVHNSFSSVWVAEWQPFGKELPTRLAVCSHCILSICNCIYFPFGFEGEVRFLNAPVLVHCLLVTFNMVITHYYGWS